MASIVETFSDGRWEPDRYPLTLYSAVAALVEATQHHREGVCSVRFEDLASGDVDAWQGLMDHLELDFEPALLSDFDRVTLKGRLGDKAGATRYSELSTEPLTKWRQTIHNPLRRAWCRRYLDWIGPGRLGVMGYDHAQLLRDLATTPVGPTGLAGDSVRTAESLARRIVRTRLNVQQRVSPNPRIAVDPSSSVSGRVGGNASR